MYFCRSDCMYYRFYRWMYLKFNSFLIQKPSYYTLYMYDSTDALDLRDEFTSVSSSQCMFILIMSHHLSALYTVKRTKSTWVWFSISMSPHMSIQWWTISSLILTVFTPEISIKQNYLISVSPMFCHYTNYQIMTKFRIVYTSAP